MFDKPVPAVKQGIRDYPGIPEPMPDIHALTAAAAALKQAVEILLGYKGRPGARAVRLDELSDAIETFITPLDPVDPAIPPDAGLSQAQVLARVSLGL